VKTLDPKSSASANSATPAYAPEGARAIARVSLYYTKLALSRII